MKPDSTSRFGWHPSPNALLLAIEGELLAADEMEINQHLQKCWQCRAAGEAMRQGILSYMTYRERWMASQEPPPSGWSGFQFRLHNVEAECRSIAREARVRRRMAWATVAAAAIALACLVLAPLARPPVV